MATRKEYQGGAPITSLATGISNSDLSLTLTDGTGYPTGADYPFVLVIDPGTATEEKVLCTGRTSNTVTIDASGRGFDGTAAAAHAQSAVVAHVLDAASIEDFSDHLHDTGNDHHTQYLNNTRHDDTARHTVGTVVPAGSTATTVQPDDSAAGGSNNEVSRSDHVHAVAVGTPVDVTTATNAEGSANSLARSDHSHGIADGAVTAAKLASDAVETVKIKDGNVTAAKLASDAVETVKIKDGNVTPEKLASTVLGGAGFSVVSGTTTGTTTGSTAGTISWGVTFDAPPVAVGVVQVGSNRDLVLNWQSSPTTGGVAYRVVNRTGTTFPSSSFTIHWIAVGKLA